MTLHVEVVSPERVLFSGEGDMVVCRTTDGEVAFMTGHAPFIGALGIAQVRVIFPPGRGQQAIAVHGGFVEVSHDKVVVLSDVAELPEAIDVERARAARAQAESRLSGSGEDPDAAAALARAQVRLEVAGAG